MSGLNYNYLYYFFRVAKDGGVTAASRNLHLTPQTVSGQLSLFEAQLGYRLFDRQGRRMVLTHHGRLILSYAEEIFQIGEELKNVLERPELSKRMSLSIGIVDVIPKALSFSLIRPATTLDRAVKLTCREGELEHLLAEMSLNRLDIVLSDRPLPAGTGWTAHSLPLIESSVGLYASEKLKNQFAGGFPKCVSGAPFLMPSSQTMLHQLLLSWFDQFGIHPMVVAELDDSALAKAFAQASLGIFAAPSVISEELKHYYGLSQIGSIDDVKLQFFALLPSKKIEHPGVAAIVQDAKIDN